MNQMNFYGIQTIELVNFFRQAGFALAGAAALWGFIFAGRRQDEVSRRLLFAFFLALAAASVFWLTSLMLSMQNAFAHEGIVLELTSGDIMAARGIQAAFLMVALLLGVVGFLKKSFLTGKYLRRFFLVQLILISGIMGLPAWTGSLDKAQLFFTAHGWHSILTLGTVLLVDFLFFISHRKLLLQAAVYPVFPLMSKVIWLGLGIDFASVFLILDEAVMFTPKFYFMQTVVGVLIINGVILSGVLTRRLLASLHGGGNPLAGHWHAVANLCGSVSIISWSSITLADQLANPTLAYWQFIMFYISAISTAVLVKILIDKFVLSENLFGN